MGAPELSEILRAESGALVATLSRLLGDVALAEDVAQEALVAALEAWPQRMPERPGAWLLTAARNAARDRFRRERALAAREEPLAHHQSLDAPAWEAAFTAREEAVHDDQLRLMFLCCHPSLPREQQTALTLRLLGGLTVEEIARAFFAEPPAIAQRIVRAKRALGELKPAFELPAASELHERLPAVLEVVYLIFNEGFTAQSGPQLVRVDLCEEAARLSRLLAEGFPAQSEALGLCALLELQAARSRARTAADGSIVLLAEQDRALWDRPRIERALALLVEARRASPSGWTLGPYQLQAAIAGCHSAARSYAETDWSTIAALYALLARVQPSPVVECNRAVAVSMVEGPEAGLRLLERVATPLRDWHLAWAVRADFLRQLGRKAEAARAYREALSRAQNDAERRFLQTRITECEGVS